MKIGYIGLGKMGLPMATNMRAAGHELIVHNRSQPKVEAFVADGGVAANSPAEVAAQADVICVNVPTPEISLEILLGTDGAVENARDGQLWIDFGTNGPDTARTCADAGSSKGVGYLDAPVSGGPGGAEAGTLAVFVGGSESSFAQGKELLDIIGGKIEHFGPAGTGCIAKLTNQMIIASIRAANAEAFVLAVKNGLNPQQLYETLMGAFAANRCMEVDLPNLVLPRDYSARFAVDLLLKDLGLALEVGRQSGVPLIATAQADQLYQEIRSKGWGDLDAAATFKRLEEIVGVEVTVPSSE
ncbi:MAG: 2-hydroxy-3-oxopropionate reductase [Chloroflexi bacterium]|nr:2-hydroxy-3-oxopropionate reductase [Chloroflexota bacterium]